MTRTLTAIALIALIASPHAQSPKPQPIDPARFAGVDRVIEEAIAAKQTPNAVVLIGRDDHIVYEKAYGQRAIVPAPERITPDTIFDLASLTKVVATTTA